MNGFYNKRTQLDHIINKFNPTIFAMNETRHAQKTVLKFHGYKIVQKSGTIDANQHAHGGVALMVKHNIKFEVIKLNTELQVVAIQVLLPVKMTIASIYIPPGMHQIPTLQQLNDFMRQIPKPFMIVGDVNSRHVDLLSPYTNAFGKLIMDFVDTNDLTIINDNKVTRVGVHGESAMLDLVIVSDELIGIFDVETTDDFYDSDHKLMRVNSTCRLIETRSPNYNYKKADMQKFKKSVRLSEIDLETNVDEIYEKVVEKIIAAADKSIPKFNTMFNSEKCVSWWSKTMKVLHEKKIKLNREWRTTRNSPHFNSITVALKKRAYYKAKQEFDEEKEKNKKIDSEKFYLTITKDTSNREIWKKVKASEGKRSKSKSIFIYDDRDNSCITDKADIAEMFSVEFLKNFKNDAVAEICDNPVLKIQKKDAAYLNNNFRMCELMKLIKKAKNTSPGEDNISYEMIKNLSSDDLCWLLDFFNKIWCEGRVPEKWKRSVVIPIPKDHTQKHNITKYRPIQLLNVTAKILQNLVASRLNYHTEKFDLNHNFQFGFSAKRSTTDNLMLFEHRVRTALEEGCEVVVVFFDLAKAFDSVKSVKIIECLKEMGIHGKFLEYSIDFLSNLKYKVKFDTEFSSEKSQINGVPQGSGLSVLLFKVIMNQLQYFFETCEDNDVFIFVDDLVYLRILPPHNTVTYGKKYQKLVQNDIDKIQNFADQMCLNFSTNKTKVMKISAKKNPSAAPKVMLNGVELEEVRSYKFLGIIFQSNMKFDQSVNEICKRIEKDLNVLKYISSYKFNIDRKVLAHVLDAKVKSKIEYLSYLLLNAEDQQALKKLIVKYNKGLRIVLGALTTTLLDSLYAESGKMHLENSALKKIARYVVNVMSSKKNPVNERLSKVFEIIDENQDHGTTKKSALRIACEKIAELNLRNIQKTETFFTHAQWLNSKIKIDRTVHMHKKDSLDSEVWTKIFKSKSEKYNKNNMLFTDGSLRDGRVGWAVTSESELIKNGRIHNQSTIITAEMRAITEAVEGSENDNLIVVTDSLSTCEMLHSMNEKNNNCRLIANKLYATNKKITIMWAPSHKGIKGNETADKFAGEALNNAECDEISENDAKKCINDEMLRIENDMWNSVSVEKNLRKLKNNTDMLIFPKTMKRIDQVKITRLRLGYIKHTEDWKFHQKDGYIGQACEVCECFTSVHHIFTECKETESSRKKLNIRFDDLNDINKFDDIIAFLKEIGKFDET